MEISNLGRTFLSFEDFPRAPGAGVGLTRLTHDGLAVHPALILGLGLVTEVCGVAVPTLNFSIVAIVEGGGIQGCSTVVTAQTVFVIRPGLGLDPLHLEDFPLAPHTGILISLLGLRLAFLPEVVLTAGTVELPVANLAVDLVIRTLDTVEVVKLSLTLQTVKAFLRIYINKQRIISIYSPVFPRSPVVYFLILGFRFIYVFLMIEPSLGDHLLRLKDFTVAPRTGLSITILALDEGGVPGHQVLARPVDLLAADVTVDVSVRTDSKNVNAEYYLH